MSSNHILGIDVGGTGMKAAIVDITTGELVTERYKIATPQPPTAQNMMQVLVDIITHFEWQGKLVGCGFPAIVKDNVVLSAINIDKSWINIDIAKSIAERLDTEIHCINDADAAAIAEVSWGAAIDKKGTILMTTLGTGIGSGLVRDGELIPNIELGQLPYLDADWEKYASNKARKTKDLSWEEWGVHLNEYFNLMDYVINPDLIVVGGGVSKKFHKYEEFLDLSDKMVAATLLNNAGIVGAAMVADKRRQ